MASDETAAERQARDIEAQEAARITAAYFSQTQERLEREYSDGGTSLYTYVTGPE